MLKFVGQKIRKARESKGISQKKLGMMLGLSDKAISSYESGRTFPPLDTLFRISTELGYEIDYFLNNEDQGNLLNEKIISIQDSLTKIMSEIEEIKISMKSQPKN